MKIVSWNVREVGSLRRRRFIKEYLNRINPDIVMLQEKKKKKGDG